MRNSLIFLAVLVLSAGLLLWFLPARWVVPWVEPQLHGIQLQQVQGLLWNGRANRVQSPAGQTLGRLHWRLSRSALWGQVRLRLDFSGPKLAFNGTMRRLADGRMQWHKTSLQADLGSLEVLAAAGFGQPQGELRATVDQALLQGGWPLQLQAQAQWQHAVMQTQAGAVALGNLEVLAQARGGVITAQLHDDGHGPLQVDSQLQLSPIGWRLDATLRPRQTDPVLHRWLSRFGSADADGTVHIHHHGGLASGLPSRS